MAQHRRTNTGFYLYDDGLNEELQHIHVAKRAPVPAPGPARNSADPAMALREKLHTKSDILKFPIESSHSYSYAQLSPNSLALRLNVLKRSLEILKDRPGLMNAIDHKEIRAVSSGNKSGSGTGSSAALAAFFRPQIQRSDSFPTQQLYAHKSTTVNPDIFGPGNDLNDVIALLEANEEMLLKNKDFTATLDDLSLVTNSFTSKNRHNWVQRRLMDALSTPFIDTLVITTMDASPNASSVALNLLNPNPNNRPFHSISLGKHALPQSVFTIASESPWEVRAANDLACLMFGVLKNIIKSLTLMDLIAPQFRQFVVDRIANVGSGNGIHTSIIFSGEIVAISRPDSGFTWTSVWAKLKGNLIIFMFDQIPCDAFDIVVSNTTTTTTTTTTNTMEITSIQRIAGNLEPPKNLTRLSEISPSIVSFLKPIDAEFLDLHYRQSETINQRRYFTLQVAGENVPCAVTSTALEIQKLQSQLKLKIHALPYIAGMFVIDANFTVLSCNNAIARNLFGWANHQLVGNSINKLIPKFSEIYTVGTNDIKKEYPVVQGLVLPEHFFRKYDIVLRYPQYSDALFMESKGLEALHMDGNRIHVDVQLRATTSDTFVLWITYSRVGSADKNQDLHDVRLNFKRTRLISGDNARRLPSQLKLFDDAHTLPTYGDIINHIPNNDNDKRAGNYKRAGTDKRQVSAHWETSSEGSDGFSNDTKLSSVFDSPQHPVYSEQFLIDQENALIAEKAKHSANWPLEIGSKRRTKKITEFTVIRDMGEGAYGKVILGQHIHDPVYKVIVKCIDKERILVDTWVRDRKLGTIPSEIQIMATLMQELHPNIMRIVDFFEDQRYYYLETPIFGNPPAIDLFDYIEVKKDMTEHECQFIFKQVVLAISHLHKHDIVHRDIKDENVIVDERGIIKLIDFGSAGYTKLGPFDVFVGTIDYASPEVLRGEKYAGKPQDVWALGILLYTILYKENPFYNVDEIMEGELRVPAVISKQPIDLIKLILVRDIDRRPTIHNIAEDSWLQ